MSSNLIRAISSEQVYLFRLFAKYVYLSYGMVYSNKLLLSCNT